MTSHRLSVAPPLPPFELPAPLRPGERREALPGLHVSRAFAGAAAKRGLSVSVATEIALERALVLADLTGLGRAELFPELLTTAGRQRFLQALPGSYRRYRASLLSACPREYRELELGEPAAVPLRFFPRVLELDYDKSLTRAALDEAIILELGALCAGRTMSEYALLFVSSDDADQLSPNRSIASGRIVCSNDT